jgi:ribosomal protein L11 methyltransferase
VAQSWSQLSVRTSPANIDALSNFLVERGAPGVIVKKAGLDAFFAAGVDSPALRRDITRFLAAVSRLSPRARKTHLRWKIVEPQNWEHAWKRFIKPRRVGKTFWVTPPWLEPPKFRSRRVITIEPGMAFGTGTHATTRGCMEFLEVIAGRLAGRKFSALDVGTGAGILAIALAHLGATEIWAIDNDPIALRVARDNLRLNGVEGRVRLSGVEVSALGERFEVVVANLTAETILELAGPLRKTVAPNGFLILSGILHRKVRGVIRVFAGQFRVVKRKRSREWITLLLQKK